MSETAGSSRSFQLSPRAAGRPPESAPDNATPAVPPGDEQPTVITRRPPLSAPSSADTLNPFEKWGLQPGDRLGHFNLVELVGGGGMGRVYRALDTRLARTVAVKVLSPDQAADGNTLLRFQNEAQSAARLDHPNIARVYYVGEDRGIPFIVFEFIEGVNIRDLVAKRGPLPLGEAVSYMLQVTAGLAHAASRDVVHRDIKPSNILITPEGTAKLIDLGLARLQRFEGPGDDLTVSGVTLGTFDYISPEQARDPRAADVRSDVYSLGCTFYYMCTGRPPFPQGTVLQKLLQHQGDQPPDVRQLRPDLPEEVSRVLGKMLAKDPRHRYQNPQELWDDLKGLADQSGVQSSRMTIGVPWAPPARTLFWGRHLPWLLPLVTLVCVALGLEFFAGRGDEPAGIDEPTRSAFAPDSLDTRAADPKAVATRDVAAAAGQAGEKTASADHSTTATSTAAMQSAAPPPTQTAAGADGSHAKPSPADAGGQAPREAERPAAALEQGPGEAKRTGVEPPPGQVAAVSAAADGAAKTPAARKPAAHQGKLTVGEKVGDEPDLSSLEAACGKAKTGEEIELRFNGRLESHPIDLGSRKLTISGGEGFQPIIVFRPSQPTEKDPATYSRSMISVAAQSLTLVNVAIEFDVPRDIPADSWSLFEILGTTQIHLKHCLLTIRNASDQLASYHPDAAFFRVRSTPGAEPAVDAGAPSSPPTSIAIELFDCVARGEAAFLRTETLQPVDLFWVNGLLATTECLLSVAGGLETPRAEDVRKIHLTHLTAVLRGGLFRMRNTPSAAFQLPTRIESSDSIFIGLPGVPLVEQSGVDSADDARRLLQWSADRNFYVGWDLFWAVTGQDQRPIGEPMSFQDWQQHWGPENENRPERQVVWKRPPDADRPLHSQTPIDYALGDGTERNPARGAAESGDDAGMQTDHDQLPAIPPDGAAATPAR
jgi:serine/threonine-protein kinase